MKRTLFTILALLSLAIFALTSVFIARTFFVTDAFLRISYSSDVPAIMVPKGEMAAGLFAQEQFGIVTGRSGFKLGATKRIVAFNGETSWSHGVYKPRYPEVSADPTGLFFKRFGFGFFRDPHPDQGRDIEIEIPMPLVLVLSAIAPAVWLHRFVRCSSSSPRRLLPRLPLRPPRNAGAVSGMRSRGMNLNARIRKQSSPDNLESWCNVHRFAVRGDIYHSGCRCGDVRARRHRVAELRCWCGCLID